jgi:hypothetical protein
LSISPAGSQEPLAPVEQTLTHCPTGCFVLVLPASDSV